MKQVILGWRNRVDVAVLSAVDVVAETPTVWSDSLPMANIQSYRLRKTARTTTTAAFTLGVDLSAKAARSIGVVAIAGHNLSRLATVQVKAFQGATEVDDSGELSPWPYLSADDPHWQAHTFGYAIVDSERIAELMPTFIYPLPANVAGNRVEITITDTGNADGFIELGRVFVGEAFKPAKNVEWGDVSLSTVDFSDIQSTPGRTKFFYRYPVVRTATLAFKHLSEGEVLGSVFAVQRVVGLTGELVFIDSLPVYHTISGVLVPDSHWFAKAFLGNPTELNALTYPNFSEYSAGFGIEEVAR